MNSSEERIAFFGNVVYNIEHEIALAILRKDKTEHRGRIMDQGSEKDIIKRIWLYSDESVFK